MRCSKFSTCTFRGTTCTIRFSYRGESQDTTLDGVDTKELKIRWLRSQIGLGTDFVYRHDRGNIADGLDTIPFMEKIEVVAKMSNACDFILQFPDGTQSQALDSESEKSAQEALDKICVVRGGKVAEQGSSWDLRQAWRVCSQLARDRHHKTPKQLEINPRTL
ncbi:hypothetical protein PF005_g26337 [Phytophthora fragariae]|uniref:Uncharacterized protein n=1 Tax=Phytophthora fragariae TaxID=53985 RepID=A0A6A3HXM7_9STRA|nr:hypothetical protein PF003_g37985 [Phytophthora fragariae]KAE8973812.1 hypothetical protein PF011_g25108 [Phytophthora fragariae]KAE9071592.1 hypothetical protein PF010_g25818 [Phytophthora fragariae]KAE9072106.1 hypothetical protein PF007_g26300 [Phytophthora fragariae]KAE9079142.1 hypothetical protein PF006_g27581 [Phytophthora fragariae]